MSKFLKKLKKRGHNSTEMNLQITSMADIFTILLVFLLKGYTTSSVTITPSNDLFLPTANASDAPADALKVEVAANGVQIDGGLALPLTQYKFVQTDLTQSGTSQTLTAIFEKLRARQLSIAKNNTDVKIDSKMIVIADKNTPYSTLKTVLASGATHGYTDFKLAVVSNK